MENNGRPDGLKRKAKRMAACFLTVFLLLLTALAFSLCGCAAARRYDSFDPDTEGLVQVQTIHESNHDMKCFALASGPRIMETDAFTPDRMEVFTVDSFSVGMNNYILGPIRIYDENNISVPLTREISTICHAMQDVGHHVMELRIFKLGNEWFASAMLNVNLWTPYQFYYFNRDSGKLMLLYTFDGRDIAAIRILSADRLHALDQDSIGGWYDAVTPGRQMAEHPEVIEDAAVMLLEREDLFDEASSDSWHHERKIGLDYTSLTYTSLLRGVTRYSSAGKERISYLNDADKIQLQTLLDQCPPYEIEQIPGSQETCTVLIFRFSVFDSEENRQEAWTLFRIDGSGDDPAYERTVLQLTKQYGELTQGSLPGWLMSVSVEQI